MSTNEKSAEQTDSAAESTQAAQPQTTRRNLDTGEDEPFDPADLEKESIMDFGSGSGGGSGGDGGAS